MGFWRGFENGESEEEVDKKEFEGEGWILKEGEVNLIS